MGNNFFYRMPIYRTGGQVRLPAARRPENPSHPAPISCVSATISHQQAHERLERMGGLAVPRGVAILQPDGRWEDDSTPIPAAVPKRVMLFMSASEDVGSLSLEEPGFLKIHELPGITHDPTGYRSLLAGFRAFRELSGREQGHVLNLWTIYESVGQDSLSRWRAVPGDVPDPQKFARDVAEMNDVPFNSQERLARVLYRLRASLAGEGIWKVSLSGNRLESEIRYRAVRGDFPVRDRTVPVPLDQIEAAVVHYEKVFGQIDEGERGWLVNGLARMEAVRKFTTDNGWRQRPRGLFLAERLFPRADQNRIRRLSILSGLLAYRLEGAHWERVFQDLPPRPTLADLIERAARLLDLPFKDVSGWLNGHRGFRTDIPLLLHYIPAVLDLLNLLSVDRPWEAVYPLYREALDWAFRIRRQNGAIFFEMKRPVDLPMLAAGGVGSLLDAARMARRLIWKEIEAPVSKKLGRTINYMTLIRYGANILHPQLDMLQALVAVLNERKGSRPVDPAHSLLAACPALGSLLPITVRGLRDPVTLPKNPPYLSVAPASPRTVFGPRVHHASEGARPLDPRGLPALVQGRRIQLGLFSLRAAQKRIGIGFDTTYKLEHEPGEGGRYTVPSRSTVARLIKGYGLDPEVVVRAHMRTCWRDDPVVCGLVQRTFSRPVMIDAYTYRRVNGFARYRFQTPMEILYYWRNRLPLLPQLSKTFEFPPSEREMAGFLGVERSRYERWEMGLMVPGDQQVERIFDRLRPPPAERRDFVAAVHRMREEIIGSGVHLPKARWLRQKRWQGIVRLLSLASFRPFYTEGMVRNLFRKLCYLRKRDPHSFLFLEREARRLANDAASPAVGRLIAVVHNTEDRVRTVPSEKTLRGAVAAVYFHRGSRSRVVERLARRILDPRVRSIVVDEGNGSFDYFPKPGPRFEDHYGQLVREGKVARQLSEKGRTVLRNLFEVFRQRGGLKMGRRRVFARRVRLLALHDLASLSLLIRELSRLEQSRWDARGWHRIRSALNRTVRDLEHLRGRAEWAGCPLRFHLANSGGGKVIRNRLSAFRQRIVHGHFARVVYRGVTAKFEKV